MSDIKFSINSLQKAQTELMLWRAECDNLQTDLAVMTASRDHWKSLAEDTAICLADNIKKLEAEKARVAELEAEVEHLHNYIDDAMDIGAI